jgi:hypothetical protein
MIRLTVSRAQATTETLGTKHRLYWGDPTAPGVPSTCLRMSPFVSALAYEPPPRRAKPTPLAGEPPTAAATDPGATSEFTITQYAS